MSTFVLVPGAWHGGWWFQPLARRLREHGHEAYAVTLTGLGERGHLLTGSVNLDTHIEDVVALLRAEEIEDAVLVGHSYAGMVISGVAGRAPGRVAALMYVDAFVPSDGDSCWSLGNEVQRRLYIEGAAADGWSVAPPPFFDPRTTRHPLASFLQPVRLTAASGAAPAAVPDPAPRRDYVLLTKNPQNPFISFYERVRAEPGWHTHTLPTGHDVMAEAPGALLELVLDAAARPDGGEPGRGRSGLDRPGREPFQ
ncbi:alpha/beta fold hydrolase [Streptomyces varsoviensis]|uniref:alpha/beta fold hydrolase n=1 Tax=Streptomyces varsoviensis TaxID=67373 RepID=UPI0007C52689|nr:alpha/beta hydrolase [Streptomyces varsoviensis]